MKRIGPSKPFRHYILEWMEKKGVNQERLAGRLDCESSTISKLLTGRQRLSDVWLSGIATALDVEVADLFRDPSQPSRDELLADLSDEQKKIVTNLINVLREAR